MNAVYAATAYPAGALSDRYGPNRLLAAGMFILVLSDLVLAAAAGLSGLVVGTILWGLHMGLTQGLLAAMVAGSVGAEYRGTAFGLFGLATGLAALAASVMAGGLWNLWGAPATFAAGAVLAAVALCGLPLLRLPRGAGGGRGD
jgi:MFS family permease